MRLPCPCAPGMKNCRRSCCAATPARPRCASAASPFRRQGPLPPWHAERHLGPQLLPLPQPPPSLFGAPSPARHSAAPRRGRATAPHGPGGCAAALGSCCEACHRHYRHRYRLHPHRGGCACAAAPPRQSHRGCGCGGGCACLPFCLKACHLGCGCGRLCDACRCCRRHLCWKDPCSGSPCCLEGREPLSCSRVDTCRPEQASQALWVRSGGPRVRLHLHGPCAASPFGPNGTASFHCRLSA
mmetsp:Transcript_17493/g.52503  ORF Transcript_17493/g.52503 Transcript_17493/m.52503 type:complete len:242 (+) Transcript_17493:3822-4547(+)